MLYDRNLLPTLEPCLAKNLTNEPSPASFSFISIFSIKHYNLLQQFNVKKSIQ